MMRGFLMTFFATILSLMIFVTTVASIDRSIFSVGTELLSDPWFHATLCDAYFGFLTIYVWVAYKERQMWSRIAWFVLIMTLGNIAIAIYILIQLATLRRSASMREILLRAE